MQVAQTSLLSWQTRVEPELTKRQLVVVNAMKQIGRPCIPEAVAIHIGKFEHQISGRFSELREKGVLRYYEEYNEAGKLEPVKERNSRGNWAYVHELVPEEAE